MHDGFLIQLIILCFLFALPVVGYKILVRTKKKAKAGYVGGGAKSIGSIFSPHLSYMKEMEGMIVNEVKKTEPRDDDKDFEDIRFS